MFSTPALRLLLLVALLLCGTTDAGCSANSFIPSWVVDSLQYAVAEETGSFRLVNRVTNDSAVLACQSDGICLPQSTGTKDIRATVVPNLGKTQLQINVNQTWQCNDLKFRDTETIVPITFTATGTHAVAIDCGEIGGTCRLATQSQVLIKGILLSPFVATPEYAEPVTGQSLPECSTPPRNELWDVTGISYVDTRYNCTPIPGPASCAGPAGVTLNMRLYNKAINYTVYCSGWLQLTIFEPGPFQIIDCNVMSGLHRNLVIQGSVFLNLTTSLLSVSQTWYCDTQGADKPVRMQAQGSAPISPSCNTRSGSENTTRPVWDPRPDPFYRPPEIEVLIEWSETSCTAEDLSLDGHVQAESLPAFALDEPSNQRTPGGCALQSMTRPGWGFGFFAVTTDNTHGPATSSLVEFDFAYYNFAIPSPVAMLVPLIPGTNQTDGDQWVDCDPGAFNRPCRFRYDSLTRRFTLNRVWKCDIDRAHPYLFNATASVTVPPLDCTQPEGSKEVCEWGRNTWTRIDMEVASPSDVSWRPIRPDEDPRVAIEDVTI